MPSKPSEGPSKKSLIVAGGVLALGTCAGAYHYADEIAHVIVGNPPPPPGELVRVDRAPVTIAIGIDRTPSSVAKELGTIKGATRAFLDESTLIDTGDRVEICTFAEHAACAEFELPDGRTGASEAVGMVDTERRKGIMTHVAGSIGEIVDAVGESPNPFVVVWTDADDNGQPLPEGTGSLKVPVRIVVPNDNFVGNADAVVRNLPAGTDSGVAVARNGEQFGDVLRGFVEGLVYRAKAGADAENARRAAEHEAATTEYQGKKEAVEGAIGKIKGTIMTVAGSFVLVTLSLVSLALYQNSRPKLKGFIVDRREQFPATFPIPEQKRDHSIRDILGVNQTAFLRPTKEGVMLNGARKLTDGAPIIEGVFYYETEPGDV